MKKSTFTILFILICLIFTGCDFNNSSEIDSLQKNSDEYTGKYLALYPFEVIKQEKPDYSWMTIQKLYNDPGILEDTGTNYGKEIYFLNIEYQVKEGESYKSLYYQIYPQKTPIYLNDFFEENEGIIRVDGNVFLTGYLESKIISELTMRETYDELNSAPKLENRYIKYADRKGEERVINLGYIRKNIFTVWGDGEKDALIATNFSPRIDSISHFGGNNTNLYNIVNDGKIHTFHIIISKPKFEGDKYYGLSAVKERDLIE